MKRIHASGCFCRSRLNPRTLSVYFTLPSFTLHPLFPFSFWDMSGPGQQIGTFLRTYNTLFTALTCRVFDPAVTIASSSLSNRLPCPITRSSCHVSNVLAVDHVKATQNTPLHLLVTILTELCLNSPTRAGSHIRNSVDIEATLVHVTTPREWEEGDRYLARSDMQQEWKWRNPAWASLKLN